MNAQNKYDYLIVGAGPCGLTVAQILAHYGKSVLVVEREHSVGGCHRVRRVDGLFTEHGPRIYISNAETFRNLLKQINLDFDSLFTEYDFNFTTVGGNSFKILKAHEIAAMAGQYMRLLINPNHGRDISMLDMMEQNGFTDRTKHYFDNVCRLTDGAGADRYTLYEFLQAINQHISAKILQPKRPNDLALFKLWLDQLHKIKGSGRVDLLLDHQVVKILTADKLIDNINPSGKKKMVSGLVVNHNGNKIKLSAKNYIFAVPSDHLMNLLKKDSSNPDIQTELQNSFGDFDKLHQWHRDSKYMAYIPIVFHWDKKLELPKIWGFPESDWGLAYIVMTDYTKFDHPKSKTVISVCITKAEDISRNNNKNSHQCNEGELIDEVFKQLKLSFPDLPDPTEAILSPGVYRDSDGNWTTKDSSFILSPSGYQPKMQSDHLSNLYWVGSHSGKQKYDFTSIESAVTNGVALCHKLIPESQKKYPIKATITLNQMIYFVILLLISLTFFFYRKKQ